MKTLTMTILAVLALALAGCSKDTIVGSWSGSDPSMPVGATADFTFEGDGNYTMAMDVQGTSITMKGTYTLQEKVLTLTPVSVDATGGAFAEIVKAQFDTGDRAPLTRTVEFKSPDEMALTTGVGTSTLTRKK